MPSGSRVLEVSPAAAAASAVVLLPELSAGADDAGQEQRAAMKPGNVTKTLLG